MAQGCTMASMCSLSCNFRVNLHVISIFQAGLYGMINAIEITYTPTADMDRTASRRSESSSRTTLMDERSNP
ncbi:transmembrane protein, putative [Medicago truncatula]|uniref:Transmembrane protein, putative n=1 Tax=Medicago truncatula TaxID=3880 RepID=G7J4F4_MEDTR|nr:transmembrane protein, putative [Medicago truncatula]